MARVIFLREVVILWHINELLHEIVAPRQIIIILDLLHLDYLLAYLVIFLFLVVEQVSNLFLAVSQIKIIGILPVNFDDSVIQKKALLKPVQVLAILIFAI